MGDLVKVGLVQAHQFDADKVASHLRGPVKKDGTQFAFNQWFLLVRPFAPGFDGPKPLEKKQGKPAFRVRTIGESLMQRLQRRKREKDAAEERRLAEERSVLSGLGMIEAAPGLCGMVQVGAEPEAPTTMNADLQRIVDRAGAAYGEWARWAKPPD